MPDETKPADEDVRHDDLEFNPALEPQSAKAWINLLEESEKAFEDWNDHCDRIDKRFANIERLSSQSRPREFNMFWANAEVIKPSIYAKPPVPVVVPKFKDRRPVYQAASEVAERCAIVAFDLAHINDLMLLIRDDVAMNSRGVAWCRYESGKDAKKSGGGYSHEKVCIDFKNRRDFLHSISRNWNEVTWVAGASYLTRAQARDRFKEYSGDEYQDAEYKVDKDAKEVGGADARERAKFWEIWDKTSKRVVWVAKGCEDILDEDDPHLDLSTYFPCPKPAYGTVQRGSLIPVPDVLQYKDQLDEIDTLTSRIHALSDALQVKGFYPAGGAEAGTAIETALKLNSPGAIMVPIANWAVFGGTKDIILWLPIDMIAQTVTALITMRKEIIQDIYQIMGLSDIMRGATDPQETLGAQQLKTQYGSTRIRDKQQELVRLARDLVCITLEIITEKFKGKTIVEMSQTQLPTQQMVQQEMQGLIQQAQTQMQAAQQKMQDPQMAQDPEQMEQLQQQMQQAQQQVQGQMQALTEKPTIDQVINFLKDNRAKSFVLDIETDSTILQDEQAEKQARTEFVQVLGNLLPQLAQMIQAEPGTAEFCGEMLKFATAPFRAGRSLDGTIDELIEQIKARGSADRPNPEMEKIKAEKENKAAELEYKKQKDQGDLAIKQQEIQQKDTHKQWELMNDRQIKMAELQAKQGDAAGKVQVQNQKSMQDREAHQAHMLENSQKMQINAQQADAKAREHQMKASEGMQRAADRRAQQAFKMSQPPGGRQ